MATPALEREILPAVILGLGPEAQAAAEALVLADRVVYGYLSPDRDAGPTRELNDIPVLGSLLDTPYQKMLKAEKLEYVLAVPDATQRRKLREGLFGLTGRLPLTVIHPSAQVSPHADVAAGVYVGPGAVVAATARLESLVWVEAGAIVEAGASLAEGATLQARSVVGANAALGKDLTLPYGAIVLPGVQVAPGRVVQAGEVVK